MPKTNDKVFCINHPDREMDKFDGQFMINRTEKDDDKFYAQGSVFVGYLFVCDICQYTEIYSVTDSEAKKEGVPVT